MSPGNLPNAVEAAGAGSVGEQLPTRQCNVCHIVSGDRWAGAEVQVAALLKYLNRLPEVRLSAIVLNPGRLADTICSSGIELKVIPEQDHGFWSTLREAAMFMHGKNVQVIHSHRYKENLVAALLKRRLGIPAIVRTQHGLPEPQHGFRRVKQTLIQSLDHFVAQWFTDRVVSVSSQMTGSLARCLPAWKIATIPNGIDLEAARSDLTPQEARRRLGIPEDCRVIGTAGRLERVKRLDLFLEMARRMLDQDSTLRFVIAGNGREEGNLRSMAVSLGLQENVMFLGHRDDAFDVLRAFDALVLSSDHEGLPMVLLEAMALGVVVVSRAVGGIPEVIKDGENGVLVSAGDPAVLAEACRGVLDDSARSGQLTDAARKRVVADFSAERKALEVRQLYNVLLGIA